MTVNPPKPLIRKRRSPLLPLQWSLDLYDRVSQWRREDFPLRPEAKRTRYPLRTIRYWWVTNAMLDECARLGRPPVIADVGCWQGILNRFVPTVEGARWVGLDWEMQSRWLELADYDQLIACDFDQPLPLESDSVDIAVCLHVLEHLPRPEFTMGELARVVRPGGVVLIGFPVLPRWMSWLRERQFARQFASGQRKPGQHCHAFWPRRSRRLATDAGLEVEYWAGSFLVRSTGSKLENHAWWIRLNQLWGAALPALGQEIFLKLRVPTGDGR